LCLWGDAGAVDVGAASNRVDAAIGEARWRRVEIPALPGRSARSTGGFWPAKNLENRAMTAPRRVKIA
jgi:hypothetical protein